MKKFGSILIAVLIGTILYEIIAPAVHPQWLRFVIELIVITVFGLAGFAVFRSANKQS